VQIIGIDLHMTVRSVELLSFTASLIAVGVISAAFSTGLLSQEDLEVGRLQRVMRHRYRAFIIVVTRCSRP